MVHKNSQLLAKEANTGAFSCGALFLGPLWYAIHGMWGKFFLYTLLSTLAICFTFGILLPVVWIVTGFRFKRERFEHLLEKGYRVEE